MNGLTPKPMSFWESPARGDSDYTGGVKTVVGIRNIVFIFSMKSPSNKRLLNVHICKGFFFFLRYMYNHVFNENYLNLKK